MALGVGMDITHIERLNDSLTDPNQSFINKTFTVRERARAAGHPQPAAYLAKVFAAKEAVFKMFSIGWESGVSLAEIDIGEGTFGEPVASLSGKFLEIMQYRGGTRILLSLSYEKDFAVAIAILE